MSARRSSGGRSARLAEVGRFLVVGLANTAVTGAIFFGLAFVVPQTIAYTIAFGLGVGFAVGVTPRFVFSARPARSRRALYAGWYLLVYLVGLGLVQVLETVVGAERLTITVVTVATTASLSYLGGRLLLADSTPQGAP
jgi:putative flippase GtrA